MQQARDFIKTGKVGRVATITIDHPPANSISTGILQELAALGTFLSLIGATACA